MIGPTEYSRDDENSKLAAVAKFYNKIIAFLRHPVSRHAPQRRL